MALSLPSVPQVVHTDFNKTNAINKPNIAFCPASSAGCMLLVWMYDKYMAIIKLFLSFLCFYSLWDYCVPSGQYGSCWWIYFWVQ